MSFIIKPVNFEQLKKSLMKEEVKITGSREYTHVAPPTISKEWLHKYMDYKEGVLYWKYDSTRTDTWNNKHIGKQAGYYCPKIKQFSLKIRNRTYTMARLIWIYHYGKIDLKGRIMFKEDLENPYVIENLDFIPFYYRKPVLEEV